jgi:hypothetical protein
MPRKNFKNFGDLQQYEYVPGVIDSIDGEADTCSVMIGENSYTDVPIYYHCKPDSPERDNGAIEGAAAGFAVDDPVVVLRQRIPEEVAGDFEQKLFVIGHRWGIKKCDGFIMVVSSQSGDEALAWDIETNSLLIGKSELSEVESELSAMGYTSPVQATASGQWASEEYPPGSAVADQPGNLPTSVGGAIWTLFNGTNPNTILPYNPDGESWNYEAYVSAGGGTAYGAYFIIAAGAFGDLAGWKDGDYLEFGTVAGEDSIIGLAVHSSGGTFNSGHLIGDILGAITETWTVSVVEDSAENRKYLHVEGLLVGPVYDSGAGPISQRFWADNHHGVAYIPWDIADNEYHASYVQHPEFENAYAPYFFKCDDGFKRACWESAFFTMTGCAWPSSGGSPLNYIQRERVFYNPVFGRDFTDWVPFAGNMAASAVNLYDSFENGDWSEPAQMMVGEELQDRPEYAHNRYDAWNATGIAQKPTGDLVFDAYSFCDYTGRCDEPGRFQTGIHVFYRRKNLISGASRMFFDLVNEQRSENGLPPYILNPRLQAAAERHATDMAKNGIPGGHAGSDGSTYKERIEEEGYFLFLEATVNYAIGENVAVGNIPLVQPEDIINGWMESEGHRANILSGDYLETGVSAVVGEDGNTYICQTFGYRQGIWPGFGAMDAADLQAYMDEHFTWAGEGDEARIPNVYLA